MRCSKTHTQITRRAFVAAAIATPAVTLAVPAADPLVNALSEWHQARADWIKAAAADPSGNSSTPECEEAFSRTYAWEDVITGTKAQSREGTMAQVQFLLADQRDNFMGEYGEGFLALIQNGLGGEAL